MAFTPTIFVPGSPPGISAPELNKFGAGIAAAAATADAATPKTISLPTSNLNTIVTSGFYRLNNANTNAPSGVDFGQLIVSRGGDTVFQFVTGFNNDFYYMRQGNPPDAGGAGAWQPWRKLWHDNMIRTVGAGTSTARLQFNDGGTWKEVGNLFDKTAMNPLHSMATGITMNALNTYYTALNISGKGYLDSFLADGVTNSYWTRIRITVDGVQKVIASMSDYRCGFFNRNAVHIAYNGGSPAPYTIGAGGGASLLGSQIGTYPDTSNTKQWVFNSDSIYFNSSLLVEVQTTTGSPGATVAVSYAGGYI